MACTSASAQSLSLRPTTNWRSASTTLAIPPRPDELLVVTRIERKWLKRDQLDARGNAATLLLQNSFFTIGPLSVIKVSTGAAAPQLLEAFVNL